MNSVKSQFVYWTDSDKSSLSEAKHRKSTKSTTNRVVQISRKKDRNETHCKSNTYEAGKSSKKTKCTASITNVDTEREDYERLANKSKTSQTS